jgi:hypothetical protein
MLGNLAFQDKAYVSVDAIGIGTTFVDSGTVGQALQVSGGAYVSGNLGIGTTNPQQKLHTDGTTLTSNGDIIQSTNLSGASTYGYLTRKSRGTLTSPSTVIIGDSLGFLQGGGYDGTSYTYNSGLFFHVDNTPSTGIVPTAIDFRTGTSSNRTTNTRLSITSGGDVLIGTISTTGTASQRLQVTGGAYVSSNVGIGTTNPTSLLHVYGPTFPIARIERVTAETTGTRSTFAAVHRTSNDMTDGFGADISFNIRDSAGVDNEIALFGAMRDGSDNSGALMFGTYQNGVFDIKAYIKSSGNFGVGTVNPTSKLHVVGNVLVSGIVTATTFVGNLTGTATTAGIATYATTAGVSTSVIGGIGSITQLQVTGISTFSNGPVFIGAATSTGTASQRLQVTGGAYVSGSIGIGTTNPIQPFQVGAAGTNVVVIDSIGEIGIGTTNPQQKLHVLGNVLVAAGASTDQYITLKPYELSNGTLSWEGSAGQLFSITNNLTSGSIFSVNDISGIPSIDVDASGTISLGAYGGNIGIGTTNPTSKLHVVGNTLISGITTLGITTATNLTSQNLNVSGISTFTDIRIASSSEKSTLVSGNTVSLVYNTGGGNVAICTNPTGPITLNVTGIPTDTTFDNRMLTFSVVAIQTSIGYACTAITLNGVSRTIRYPGAVVSTASTSSYDIFNLTGINTVGSASTTANYQVLGIVNGNFK